MLLQLSFRNNVNERFSLFSASWHFGRAITTNRMRCFLGFFTHVWRSSNSFSASIEGELVLLIGCPIYFLVFLLLPFCVNILKVTVPGPKTSN